MADIPQEIYPWVTTQKLPDGTVINHLIFGYIEIVPGVKAQPLTVDDDYMWAATKPDGTPEEGIKPGKLGIVADGDTIGKQVFINGAGKGQYIDFKLYRLPKVTQLVKKLA